MKTTAAEHEIEVSQWVWIPQRPTGLRARALGGKGANLARLAAIGQPVPPCYVVTTEAFCRTLADHGLDRRIARCLEGLSPDAGSELSATSEQIRGWIRDLELPRDLEQALLRAHQELIPQDAPVAVRSSAADEDAAEGSLAGLHESVLAVRGPEAVLDAVRKVWASAYGEGALVFRLSRGMSLKGIAMGVVVHQMVDPRASGVMFTANPATGDVHQILISSLYGVGQGLVGAGFDADRFTVDKQSLEVENELAIKRERLVVSEVSEEGLRREDVPEPLQPRSSLTPDQIQRLARSGLEIERRLGRPQDIEFAIDHDENLCILQTRPIVTLEEYGPAAGNRCLWDVENWAENYPGVSLPMTYSLVRRWDRIGRRCFAEMFRIDPQTIRDHPVVFDANLGYIRGRICSNNVERYRFFRLVPGFDFNRPGLLKLLRIGEQEIDREMDNTLPSTRRRYLVELPRLLRLAGALTRDLLRVRRLVDELLAVSHRFHERCAAMDFRAMAPHELIAIYDEAEVKLVWTWKVPMLNALYLRLFYVILKKLCASWCGDQTGSLQNELLRGEEGSESGKPVKMLLTIAFDAYRDPALRELFERLTPEELAERIPSDRAFASFAASVEHYMDRYYFKGIHEMKLEGDTLRDRPEFLYQMIRNYVTGDEPQNLDPELRQQRERRARREAEARAFGALRPFRSLLPRRLIFRWLLGKVRFLDQHREEIKFMRLELMGLFRELLRALGERMAAERVLEHPRDVFYLSIAEVTDYIRGNAVTSDLRGLVALRRQEVASWENDDASKPDDRFETYGMVYHRNRFKSRSQPEAPVEEGQLRGTGCCHGTRTGTVVVLGSPNDAVRLRGEILAVERIHTGWIPLFPAISGLLVERGEILSHSTTVAREMGIPTIVGIPALLANVKSGQRVTMDGATGCITIV